MERANTITYLKGETTGTEPEGREGEGHDSISHPR